MRTCALVVTVLVMVALTSRADQRAPTSAPVRVRIALVGDSTVTDKAGWGPGFKAMLADDVECANLALGGRSSKSYRNEGHWDKLIKTSPKPDYVLIQFGHNDTVGMKKGPERETEADTEFRANTKRYVEEARAAGIKPVLVTSLVRREFRDDGKIHSSLVPYVDVTKQVAQELNVPLIDLHARSIAVCERMGNEGCYTISPRKADGTWDGTHLNARGAEIFGAIVADELRRAVPELSRRIQAKPASTQPSG